MNLAGLGEWAILIHEVLAVESRPGHGSI